MVTSALGFTPYNATNPSNFISLTSLSGGSGITYNNTTGVIASTITQYTDSNARASISLTTTGTSGAATYNPTTGVLNIPSYTGGSGGSSTWGSITGTLSSQTDLQNALNAKQNSLGFTPYNATNPNGYISANQSITLSGDISGVGTTAITTTLATITQASTGSFVKITLDTKGRVTGNTSVLSSDITTTLGYTPYNSTNPSGYTNNVGTVTSVSGSGTAFGLTLSGTITTSGNITIGGTLAVPIANITATGTPSATTYLRGDGSWATITSGSGGTVTSVSALTIATTGTDITSSVANSTSTPVITLNIPTASAFNRGALSSTDWSTFNNKQSTITLTTTGSSGSATFTTNTLNVPTYTLAGLGGQASSTNLTSLSGLTFASTAFVKMTASGTFSLDTNTYYLASNPSGYTNNTGTVTSVAALTLGTTGTDVSSSVANGSTTAVITLNIPSASATNRGVLTSADWTTFNGKQSAITLTTTGSSGSATFITNTLNIPTYTLAGLGGQASSNNLTSLSGLTFVSTAFVKMTASGTFALDTNTYLTANQSITLSGAITGTGTTTISTSLASGIVGVSNLSATGTPSATTYLRGDNTWATISGGGFSGVLSAGTATTAPLEYTLAGSVLKTTPIAGDFEADVNGISYYTHNDSSRGVMYAEQFISIPTTAYTLTSQTAAQKLFNTTTNGAVTVKAGTTYYFECFYSLSSMSGTSGTFGFALGGTATFTSLNWTSQAIKATTGTTAGTLQTTFNTTAANTTIVTASTQTGGSARITGTLRVNASGTIIPSVSLSVAAAAIVGVNSYFRIIPIGTNTVTSVGNWS
jgi:hypothetical protein